MKKLFVATSSNYKLAILKMVYKSIETISHHSDEHINEQGDPKDESLRIAKDKVLSIDISKDFSNQLTASHVDTTQVTFRKNSKHSIEKYVEMEDALDCAGGFKIESLGSLVISKVASTDPFALQGVPLLWIVNQLSQFKINPLNSLAEES
jgi:predicted house-cleaning NTP pyrophosphatase (Maf/HAM1 superfamily)